MTGDAQSCLHKKLEGLSLLVCQRNFIIRISSNRIESHYPRSFSIQHEKKKLKPPLKKKFRTTKNPWWSHNFPSEIILSFFSQKVTCKSISIHDHKRGFRVFIRKRVWITPQNIPIIGLQSERMSDRQDWFLDRTAPFAASIYPFFPLCVKIKSTQ